MHFQLRNLLWALSRNDVFHVHESHIHHWNPVSRRSTSVMDLSGGPAGPGKPSNLGRVQVSTMAVGGGLLAVGGFNGELVVKVSYYYRAYGCVYTLPCYVCIY